MRPALPALVAGFLLVPIASSTAAQRQRAPGGDGTTGRLLVTLKRPPAGQAQAAAARAVAASTGATPTRLNVPQLRLTAVRARAGQSLRTLAKRLRADPRVARVTVERRFALRYVPNDPAFTTPERGAPGTVAQWWSTRESLDAAWDLQKGDGAKVAVIDTGVDATHPEFQGRLLEVADFDDNPADGPPTVDEVGHGTHVASLACGAANNGAGIAGAGLNCGLLVAKTDLSEGSVARALVWAADRGAEAINMSFGTTGSQPAAQAVVEALKYAVSRGAVLVSAAADSAIEEQGDPSNVLQPTNSGANLDAGLGLSVTAADARDQRALFAGRGTQISMAAYGTYGAGGPSGLLGAFPAYQTRLERGGPQSAGPAPCRCRTSFDGDTRYAYLPGTSMAAPQVAAVAALMRHLNPDLGSLDVVRLLKQTATRPQGVAWTPDLGWGILNAGAALAAARVVDRRAPVSRLTRPKVTGRTIALKWRGSDKGPPGIAASGVDYYELWRAASGGAPHRIKKTRGTTMRVRGMRGKRYSFFTIAVDRAGNREAPPPRADASVRVSAAR